MQIEEIKEFLPQRYPFLLVDRVISVDLEVKRIICYKNVSSNEPFFNGHFPDHSVMPGVLILEAMAQASGLLGFSVGADRNNKNNQGQAKYYFAAADKVRFRQPVTPGDKLVLTSEVLGKRKHIWRFACKAEVDNQVVSSADIVCARKEI